MNDCRMIHPSIDKKNACVGVVCLSLGVLGEPSVSHELVLIKERLKKEFNLKVKFMDNSLMGDDFLRKHPEAKAADLRQAFLDPEVTIIWSALGGDDTFRTLPYLMNDEFRKAVQENPKPFLGFSDTTNNHLMLNAMGLSTFYAPALLSDIAELGPEIFPYTKEWIKKLFTHEKNIILKPSPVWYKTRSSFGPDQLGVKCPEMVESHGHEYLYGEGIIEGDLLGGCLDSLYEMLVGGRYPDQMDIYSKYSIFPEKEKWKDKIIFLENSEEKPTPSKLRKMLTTMADQGVFDVAKGLIIGKPCDECYYDEYKDIYSKLATTYRLPTVYNLNFGHSNPRMIIPYEKPIRIDFNKKNMSFPQGLI